jgi:hypothetical protein
MPTGQPDQPQDLRAANVWSRAVDLNWSDQATDEDGYIIEISYNGVNWNQLVQLGPDVASYRIRDLLPRHWYAFRVSAFNRYGWSNASVPLGVWTTDEAPAPPGFLRLENVFRQAVDLQWQDLSDNETHFRLQFTVDGTNWQDDALAPADSSAIRVVGLSADTQYRFRIRSANAVGFSDWVYSDWARTRR